MDSRIKAADNSLCFCLGALLFGTITFAIVGSLKGDSPSVWSRGMTADAGVPSDSTYQFRLYAITQDKLHLDATWLYANLAGSGKSKALTVSIDARRDKNGILWPKVRLEVRNEETGQWMTIGKSSDAGKRMTVTIPPGVTNFDLFVELDAFKPFVRKHKFGKVILANGQASQFELKYLLPPGEFEQH